eukprot:UC1_evm1s1831
MSGLDVSEMNDACVFLGTFSNACALLLEAFVLSIAVRKFMRAKPIIEFTKQLAFNTRNNEPFLQVRVANLRGNAMLDTHVDCTWVAFSKSTEGESYAKLSKLLFTGPDVMKAPGTFSHPLNKDSPMYKSYLEAGVPNGLLIFTLKGYDVVLNETIMATRSYKLPEDALSCRRFADVLVPDTFITQIQVDFHNFHCTVRSHDDDGTCFLCKYREERRATIAAQGHQLQQMEDESEGEKEGEKALLPIQVEEEEERPEKVNDPVISAAKIRRKYTAAAAAAAAATSITSATATSTSTSTSTTTSAFADAAVDSTGSDTNTHAQGSNVTDSRRNSLITQSNV